MRQVIIIEGDQGLMYLPVRTDEFQKELMIHMSDFASFTSLVKASCVYLPISFLSLASLSPTLRHLDQVTHQGRKQYFLRMMQEDLIRSYGIRL